MQSQIETLTPSHTAVLHVLRKKGASWIAEISWDTMLSEYEVKTNLVDLKRMDLVEEQRPSITNPQPELIARVPQLSAAGQGGYQKFCQKRWIFLTTKGKKEVRRL